MKSTSSHEPAPVPILDHWMEDADDFARREPLKAVVSAFGAGFIINLMPVGSIVGALVGIAFAMARPLLIFFGLIKVCEFVRARNTTLRQ